jgi:Acyl-CoA dehydrogenase, N-terminal domain
MRPILRLACRGWEAESRGFGGGHKQSPKATDAATLIGEPVTADQRGGGEQMGQVEVGTGLYEIPQEMVDFRETIRQIATDKIAPRAGEIDRNAEYPHDIRKILGEQDILGLPFDEAYGGTGTGTLVLQIAVEEIAKACASSALILMIQSSARCRSPLRLRRRSSGWSSRGRSPGGGRAPHWPRAEPIAHRRPILRRLDTPGPRQSRRCLVDRQHMRTEVHLVG